MKFKFNPLSGNIESIIDIHASIGLVFNLPCDPTVFSGSVVRIAESGTVFNAIATSLENSNVLGIVENKLSDTVCNVRVFGVSRNLYSSLDVTKQYYLSDTEEGQLTTIAPVQNNSIKVIVGIPIDDQKLLVFKSERQLIKINFIETGAIEFGVQLNSDLSIDTGSRENDTSVIDQGLRVIDGNI
jgi:hypothetical protein